MSVFKFACPVCGQHITADSADSGGELECPTCFRKIIVPQAPASSEGKFILAAAQASKPRPHAASPLAASLAVPEPGAGVGRNRHWIALVFTLGVLCTGVGAGYFLLRGGHPEAAGAANLSAAASVPKGAGSETAKAPAPAPVTAGVSAVAATNIAWTLELTNVAFADIPVSGRIHGDEFSCDRAILFGGNLTFLQGQGHDADGVTISLFAPQGESLSEKTVEIQPDKAPPLPRVTLRWHDEVGIPGSTPILGGYALRVSFGPAAQGRISGKILLFLPDEDKSYIVGNFNAEIRHPQEPRAPRGPKPPRGKRR